MQTFLPYADFEQSMRVLDHKRLGKQRVEVIQTYAELAEADALPPWLCDEALQISHRSSLLRKDPEYYGTKFPGTPTDVDYVWPVRSPAVIERELRKEEAAQRRAQRAAEKLARERERAVRVSERSG